jgi:site-specific recombinase XerD
MMETAQASTQPPSDPALGTVIEETRRHMVRLGYSRASLSHFARAWRKLAQFAADTGAASLSVELTESFLRHCGVGTSGPKAPAKSGQRQLTIAMRYLLEFQRRGSLRRRPSMTRRPIPEVLSRVLDAFVRFCTEERRIRPRTMRGRLQHVRAFLTHLASRGHPDVHAIDVESVSGFISAVSAHGTLKPRTLAVMLSDLRSFFRYLTMEGLVPGSLVGQIPRIRVRPDARVPDVWRAEDIAALLAAIDRGSPLGKRDYAIVLLAARLGMRVGDIRSLRLEDLRWDDARIEVRQSKTGMPLVLPLTEEIGEALIAYLRHGRPPTTRREVFLRHLAPFEPFGQDDNLYHVVATYRRRAGIAPPKEAQKGLHSLRHTLATRLLQAGVPLETIAGVLGHASPDTTRLYTRVDLTALRSAALDLEGVRYE